MEVDKTTYDKIVSKNIEWLWQVYRPFTILWTIRGTQIEVETINKNITILTQKRLGISTGLTEFLQGNYTQYLAVSTANQTQSATTRTSVTPSTTTTYTPPSSPTMGGGGY